MKNPRRKSLIWIVAKKEFARFFKDTKMMLTTLLLPGLMIYVLYSVMGDGIMSQLGQDETAPIVYVENTPASLESTLSALPLEILSPGDMSAEEMKAAVRDQAADLYVSFPKDFDEAVAVYDAQTLSSLAPNVEIYFNTASTPSGIAYETITTFLDQYESLLSNKFDVNRPSEEGMSFDMASQEDTTAMIFSMMLPMLLMVFLFSGCMAVAPESIAGEKERGTIATLLVTPMKRSELAIGKVLSLSVISLLSGISSFLGTMLSLPKLMGGDAGAVDASIYQPLDYLLLLFLILSTVLIMVALISMVSAASKSVKAASAAITPLMILVMFLGITTMFGAAPADPLMYCIPIYNSVQCMNGIFSFDYNGLFIGITLGVNLVFTVALVYAITKMFNSEKVMFSI